MQEQLRQLAIIEEEENTQTNDVSGNSIDRVSRSKNSSVKLRNSPEEPSVDESMDSVTSDLEKFEGDLYDKMIDMDRNYRNYCGFDKDFDVKTADSKVLYFQDKVLKQNYGSDNYYNPRGYYGKEYGEAGSERLDSSMGSVGSLPRNMSLPRDYTSQENSSYRSSTSYSSGVGSVDGRFHQLTNMSMDNIRVPKNLTLPGMPGKGHFSSSDNLTQNGRRPLFASSADIQKLFQTRDNISDQLQRPASCRHSFHAMPCTQQWIVDAQNEADINVPSLEQPQQVSPPNLNPHGILSEECLVKRKINRVVRVRMLQAKTRRVLKLLQHRNPLLSLGQMCLPCRMDR